MSCAALSRSPALLQLVCLDCQAGLPPATDARCTCCVVVHRLCLGQMQCFNRAAKGPEAQPVEPSLQGGTCRPPVVVDSGVWRRPAQALLLSFLSAGKAVADQEVRLVIPGKSCFGRGLHAYPGASPCPPAARAVNASLQHSPQLPGDATAENVAVAVGIVVVGGVLHGIAMATDQQMEHVCLMCLIDCLMLCFMF